jgi:pyruvate-formate lyase-activating enzyme
MDPSSGLGLADALEFAKQLLRAGVAVECSVVARPEVNLELAEVLALDIGATFKARPYYP